ncbi:MAG: serine/threonine-protein kinase [Myxococcota bacterium]
MASQGEGPADGGFEPARATPDVDPGDSGASSDDPAFDALLLRLAGGGDGLGDEEPLKPGERLGPFEVGAPLGRGGMGVVYRAENLSLRRTVALKVLHPAYANDPERRRRLLREARAAAAVNHPNIAAIHEVGELDGRIYVAMELVEGESLRARMSRAPLSLPEVRAIAGRILEGLGAAHAAGLVHRDLKPDNVMLTPTGNVRLLDFGLAKRAGPGTPSPRPDEPTSLVTRAGHVLGTPGYMSPEQAVGDPVDARTDLFSFGVVLYELLVGRRPFSGSNQVKLMASLLGEQPVTPVAARPEVGQALSAVVMRCLAKHPHDRFPDAASVRQALEAAAVPPRRRRWPILAGTGALSLVAMALVGWWEAGRVAGGASPDRPAMGLAANDASCTLARECASGSCVQGHCRAWSTTVAGQGADSLNVVSVGEDGRLLVTGWFRGMVDLGCGPFTAAPTPDMANFFVARFDREGNCVWSRRFSQGGMGNDVIAAPNGHVIVLAEVTAEADYGGGPIPFKSSTDIQPDILLLELDENGNHVRSMSIGGTDREVAFASLDPNGNLMLFGSFVSPTLDFGPTRLTLRSPGYADAFVAKLSPTWEVLWVRTIASASRQGGEVIYSGAVDARGDIAVMGYFYESLDVGGVALTSAGEADTFLAKLSGEDGRTQWALRYGTGADEPYEGAIAFAEDGGLFIAGEHRGATLGSTALPGTIYVAALSSAGEVQWARGFGGESPRDCARRVVLDQQGAPIVFGRFLSKELLIDERRLVNRGGSDLYVARFDPHDGRLLGAQTYVASQAPARALAFHRATNNLLVGGRFEGSLDFGAGKHQAFDQDGYLASLGPPP